MKLLTYNFLTSKCIKGVKVGYPLLLHIEAKQEIETEFNAEFLTRIIPRLEWPTILEGAKQIGCVDQLPTELLDVYKTGENIEFLKNLHHVLLEVDITEGSLECPETGRKFPITNGIPNMLLNEDEV